VLLEKSVETRRR